MGQKTISLTPDAFDRLKRIKRPKESFSDVVMRLVDQDSKSNKSNISECFGTLVESEEGEWDKILENIYRDRSKPRSRDTRIE
nr:antitoxin VapB family protein [Candidatus Sigynarchaeota archaeon]